MHLLKYLASALFALTLGGNPAGGETQEPMVGEKRTPVEIAAIIRKQEQSREAFEHGRNAAYNDTLRSLASTSACPVLPVRC